jgi:hypothetical protein
MEREGAQHRTLWAGAQFFKGKAKKHGLPLKEHFLPILEELRRGGPGGLVLPWKDMLLLFVPFLRNKVRSILKRKGRGARFFQRPLRSKGIRAYGAVLELLLRRPLGA